MRNLGSNIETETIAYLNAYNTEMNALIVRREEVRAKSVDPEAFDVRMEAYMESVLEAVYYLESYDFIYIETLIKAMKTFLDSEQPS